MPIFDSQLKAFLLDKKLISESDLATAETEAKKTKQSLADILLAKQLIPEEELRKLEAYIVGLPFVNLERETINPAVLNIIPEPIAKKNNIISYKTNGKELEVAIVNPDDIRILEFVKKKTGLKILPRLATTKGIANALSQYQKSLETEFGEIIKKESDAMSIISDTANEEAPEDLKKMAEDLPVIKIVDTLLRHAILQNASDIHVEPAEKEINVRYRIDGILRNTMVLPKQIAAGVVARIKVMANLKLDEHRLPQDGRFKVETPEYKISFRVSILPVFDGEKIVMRLLPESSKGYTLETLGFNAQGVEKLHRNIRKTTGIILATGPTGSGKTTTLYTLLDMLNKPGVNISTVEDPIEYRMPRINQTQVRPEIGLSFANGLRSLLRQDPDIIMVGEIRDNETANLAINAALTGHLVLSTLHTNSAGGAIPRLLDMNVEPFLIASTLNAVIAQRLVRTLCKEKISRTLKDFEIETVKKNIDPERLLKILSEEKIIKTGTALQEISFAEPAQSESCPDGYKGRIGIHEVLEVSPAIKELIVKNATSDDIQNQARKEGMITMLEDGFLKAAQGITSIEEILRVTSE